MIDLSKVVSRPPPPPIDPLARAQLWPLLHYEQDMTGTKRFDWGVYDAHKRANEAFAEVVMSVAHEGDLIWAHDYHLMILPLLLRRRLPRATIAWFLHTPFPSSEVFRTLPVRGELLRCLLACDLVGFHTPEYARHFASACARVLPGVELSPTAIAYHGSVTRIGAFPIGIEPESFVAIARSDKCVARIAELSAQFAGQRVIVSVDRLDPIKGIPHRLLGLEQLFRRHPEWIGRITFLQVAVPSRVDVATYQRLTNQVEQLVGRINGTYGSLVYTPGASAWGWWWRRRWRVASNEGCGATVIFGAWEPPCDALPFYTFY
jgi:trehalose-6-phosphate synthase